MEGETASQLGLEKRHRTLTEKGTELFKTDNLRLFVCVKATLEVLKGTVKEIEEDFPTVFLNIDNSETELKIASERYHQARKDYVDFLSRQHTPEGAQELEHFNSFREKTANPIEKSVRVLFEKLDQARQRALETRSMGSRSLRSDISDTSSVSRKRAEAEAEKARLAFVEQEVKLKKQQSNIAAELELLEHKKKVAATEAEANYLESQCKSNEHIELPQEIESTSKRTENYVLENAQPHPYMPQCDSNVIVNSTERAFAQYVYRKDLIKDRLQTFSGKHEHYLSWKQTFRSVVQEIGANSAEELDLLLRWSGPATKQIQSIKSANTVNFELGLSRAWNRLDKQFGAPEKIEQALRKKLECVSKITWKEPNKLFELSDILSEIRSVKENPDYAVSFGYLDTAAGVNPTIVKLPGNVQNKWRDRAQAYKRNKGVLFPPYTFFCDFICEMADSFNDPSFELYNLSTSEHNSRASRNITVNKTTVENNEQCLCFLHQGKHLLNECRTFRHKTLDERKKLLKQNGVCFKCCSGKHLCKMCESTVRCNECQGSHATAMHIYREAGNRQGGESSSQPPEVVANCTQLCTDNTGKSCAKIVLVTIRDKDSDCQPLKAYAIIDDQSNHTLARSELFNYFAVNTPSEQYSLRSCGGKTTLSGRRHSGFIVDSLDGLQSISLPVVTECDMIPENKHEIATPEVAASHLHLKTLANQIPPLDHQANILILIGRDSVSAHHVLDQKIGHSNQPFAQKLRLGWVIIGECCLDGSHIPSAASSMKTFVHGNGRPSTLEPCENAFTSERLFIMTESDNKVGLSVEDKQFNKLMAEEMKQNSDGNWVAPLPFKFNRSPLPNNRKYALKRTGNFIKSLHTDSRKRQHTLDFMQALFDNNHAERVPDLGQMEEVWYLPLFGVYHPKKKDSIRIVFDSSAMFGGMSLNNVLMSGPNLTNNLLGVLLRFRMGQVAVIADIQQMFYSFLVRPDHRNYLRFVWPEDNDLKKGLVDYRMKVHVFGNKPSPAVATYGLNLAARTAVPTFGSEVLTFVQRNFYVDDGLSSHDTASKAIDLLKKAQDALKQCGNLRLHKICSNSPEVLAAFDKEDLAKDLKDLDLDCDFPLQRSLGVCWNVQNDTFTFNVTKDQTPVTRRNVLSTINGLYDPLGLVAAFTITGKLLLRESLTHELGWDEPLPDSILTRWQIWVDSLGALQDVHVPRAYYDASSDCVDHQDLHIYADASEKAVAAVAYLITVDKHGQQHKSFVLGKAKVAPKHGHTIPRLELCAAVLATEIYEICRDELDMNFRHVKFFTDSKVVLGYIHNETKRFLVYVGNRIDRIRSCTEPDQWNYVPTNSNPADDATRGLSAADLVGSKWLNGPSVKDSTPAGLTEQFFPLVLPEEDKELRSLKTELAVNRSLGCMRFERFSSWDSVLSGVATLKSKVKSRFQQTAINSMVENRESAQRLVIKNLQHESFVAEIQAISQKEQLPKNSCIRNLSPYLDGNGILRVGGRLRNANLKDSFSHPIIIPRHHLSMLLIRHFHQRNQHQGRHITEGAIRNAGFWLIGCKRQVSSYIYNCVQCRKSRGKLERQKMSDLPLDRLEPTPPFTNVGIDVFGPWQVSCRRTRGGQSNSKRWALLLTCLVTRAVHIELLEEMTSSAFINALRRFCALRGEVRIVRSDCGTNFIGATGDLHANVINVDDRPIQNYLTESGINWIFNPPHSSHMGGVWERLIGVARKILDNMLSDVRNLTHEVLQTLMCEVCSIMNARPLTPVPDDPDIPFPLTPATLLTLKTSQEVQSFNVGDFCAKDLYREQWRRVQYLADTFWLRWKNEYLHTLQQRTKWQDEKGNPKPGDIVLLRDKSLHRNDWSLGVIAKTHMREDGCVRSMDIRVAKDRKVLTRPITDIVVLVSE